MEWVERNYADNALASTERWSAILSIVVQIPTDAERLKMPNSCNSCHTDKNTAWATDALKQWKNESPWRVAN